MATKTAFISMNKIKDCIGRADYITSSNRQENLLFSLSNVDMQYWNDLQRESEEIASRELIVAIPNEYKPKGENDNRINDFVSEYVNQFHDKNGCDYVVGVHNNKGNLHMHVMFSERQLENPNNEPVFKEKATQARWLVDGKYVTKKVYNKAVENGNPNTEFQPKKSIVEIENRKFGNKDDKYKSREWLDQAKSQYVEFCNNRQDKEVAWRKGVQEGHLAQVHIGKGNPEKYEGIKQRRAYNEYVKQYNKVYDWVISTGQDIKAGVTSYFSKFRNYLRGEQSQNEHDMKLHELMAFKNDYIAQYKAVVENIKEYDRHSKSSSQLEEKIETAQKGWFKKDTSQLEKEKKVHDNYIIKHLYDYAGWKSLFPILKQNIDDVTKEIAVLKSPKRTVEQPKTVERTSALDNMKTRSTSETRAEREDIKMDSSKDIQSKLYNQSVDIYRITLSVDKEQHGNWETFNDLKRERSGMIENYKELLSQVPEEQRKEIIEKSAIPEDERKAIIAELNLSNSKLADIKATGYLNEQSRNILKELSPTPEIQDRKRGLEHEI